MLLQVLTFVGIQHYVAQHRMQSMRCRHEACLYRNACRLLGCVRLRCCFVTCAVVKWQQQLFVDMRVEHSQCSQARMSDADCSEQHVVPLAWMQLPCAKELYAVMLCNCTTHCCCVGR